MVFMISSLNHLIEHIEAQLSQGADAEIDIEQIAREHGITGYHLRRMFSALSGMPVSEYLRRRRMTRAAGDLLTTGDSLLDVAVRHGYGSTEAFNRAFRTVHGKSPAMVREQGGPISNQQVLRFSLTVEGSTPMNVRILTCPEITFAGYAATVPLIYEGANPHILEHVRALSAEQHQRLRELAANAPEGVPPGVFGVTIGTEQDSPEGTELTYLHGACVVSPATPPADLDTHRVAAGEWVVFQTSGPHPETVQNAWAASATNWFPSNPWQLRPGPSLMTLLEHNADFTQATCEIWMPVEAITAH